jgi:hypothetical protein
VEEKKEGERERERERESANATLDIDLCHNDGSIVDNNCFRLVSEKRLRFALIICSLVNLIK